MRNTILFICFFSLFIHVSDGQSVLKTPITTKSQKLFEYAKSRAEIILSAYFTNLKGDQIPSLARGKGNVLSYVPNSILFIRGGRQNKGQLYDFFGNLKYKIMNDKGEEEFYFTSFKFKMKEVCCEIDAKYNGYDISEFEVFMKLSPNATRGSFANILK